MTSTRDSPNHAVELVERFRHIGGGAFVVPGRERVAGVEAHRDSRVVIQTGEHLRDLFEARADAAAEPRIVLDQKVRRLRAGSLEHVIQMLQD